MHILVTGATGRIGAKFHRLIYASTEAVYWRLDMKGRTFAKPIEETDVSPTHQMPYDLTKWIGEKLWMNYGIQYGLPTTTMRFSTVFEPSEFLKGAGRKICNPRREALPRRMWVRRQGANFTSCAPREPSFRRIEFDSG